MGAILSAIRHLRKLQKPLWYWVLPELKRAVNPVDLNALIRL